MNNLDFYRFNIGRFNCAVIKDFDFVYQARDFATNATLDEINEMVVKYHGKPNIIPSPYIALWIDTGEQQMLIDTGLGYSDQPFSFQGNDIHFRGRLLNVMKREGIDPAAIDTVVLTHFHPDHIGGIFNDDGQVNFPNAQFIFYQEEWDFWFSDQAAQMPPLFSYFIKRQISPLKDYNTRAITGEEVLIAPGIQAIFVPGHTPGHMIVSIESEGEKLIYATDTVLHPMLMEKPHWKPVFDCDPDLAHASRDLLLNKAVKDELLLCLFHFPFPGLGYVIPEDNHWLWKAEVMEAA